MLYNNKYNREFICSLRIMDLVENGGGGANKCKNRKEYNKFTYTHVSMPISHVVLGH